MSHTAKMVTNVHPSLVGYLFWRNSSSEPLPLGTRSIHLGGRGDGQEPAHGHFLLERAAKHTKAPRAL